MSAFGRRADVAQVTVVLDEIVDVGVRGGVVHPTVAGHDATQPAALVASQNNEPLSGNSPSPHVAERLAASRPRDVEADGARA